LFYDEHREEHQSISQVEQFDAGVIVSLQGARGSLNLAFYERSIYATVFLMNFCLLALFHAPEGDVEKGRNFLPAAFLCFYDFQTFESHVY